MKYKTENLTNTFIFTQFQWTNMEYLPVYESQIIKKHKINFYFTIDFNL